MDSETIGQGVRAAAGPAPSSGHDPEDGADKPTEEVPGLAETVTTARGRRFLKSASEKIRQIDELDARAAQLRMELANEMSAAAPAILAELSSNDAIALLRRFTEACR